MAQSQNLPGLLRRGAILLVGAVAISARARAAPANCLRFNGTNGYVSVPPDAALNAYPLTLTAWIRTSRNAPLYDGIVNKYFPGSGNGYSFHVYNGHLWGWYFGSAGWVYPGDPGFDGGFVADGQWHHVAMVIGPGGGAIYIDGASRGMPQGWTGTSSATTSNTPVTIGRYATTSFATNTFAGDIDEVGIWNRALSLDELNYLKHRRLNGQEDGLLSLWHFDEGSGTTSADAAPAGRTATLNGAAAWAASAAPVVLSMVATNCLSFEGATSYVSVPPNTNLNAYPFTTTAWFRTTNTASFVQGIVSKYFDASFNGWSLFVQYGRLRGFYYRPPNVVAIDFTSAATVADGGWHHAALTVDAAGGKLWLDGNVVGTGTWSSTPMAPTNAEPVLCGGYTPSLYVERFQGALDEITVWSRALTTNEIQSLKNRPLTGNEPNLLAYWRLDEGAGTTVGDASGHGHSGSFVGTPRWVGSTASLGDGSVHLVASADIPVGQRFFAISGGYPGSLFDVKANATFWRFYDFGPAPTDVLLAYKLDAGLRIAPSGTPLAVKPNTYSNAFNLAAYNASGPVPSGASGGMATVSQSIDFEPAAGVQLDSVNNLHQMTATLALGVNGGAFVTDGTEATAPARLLHFNGRIVFGPVEAVVTNVVNTPTNGAVFAPTHLVSQLQIAPGGAFLAAGPGVHFGGGAAFTVNLGATGIATNVNGSFSLSAPDQFFESAGIRYTVPGATLDNSGLTASNLLAWFPTGFGMATSTNVRAMTPYLATTNIVLGPDLLPTTDNLIFTAASYGTNELYFAEDSKPFFIGASQIEWHVPQGEFYLAQADSLQFVRQQEDDDLAAQRPNLVEPLAADRISNDGYYHNVAATAGTPVYIRPDTNGAALLTIRATLQENEYRPHFPYVNRGIGGHIPVVGGALVISNDLVNTASSYLLLAGPAPMAYARDCSPEGGCAGFATNSPQVLEFSAPPGHLGLGEFRFTPDGGLLAYGTIPPTNLTWGFIGGSDYAQRTSDVRAGVLHIPGTFLAGPASSLPAAQLPAVLLFTGWGNATNATNTAYVERPGQSNYADGFANYAGLNFRAPAQGRSFLAGTNTGFYPLTSRSKYYVRFGGVSGIHESASFPTNLTLYGYAFTFASYRLTFLDSDNWESRTDGRLSLPVPAGFPVEFERMKFLCRGNLDAAELPATVGTKHLIYWNTDIQPMSLEFKPLASDPCSLSTRFLVLGAQTKLPFIPNAFQATLGFKPTGNLVTPATRVLGVDSRFAVPADLRLQGSGGSYFPLTTAAEGYFNNWETSGKPDRGFFNLVGRLRVPFFRDVKVQLHVTPASQTNADIAIMGGWPAEEGLGASRGWNVGSQNYFNTATFDPNSDGWPTSVNLANYRGSPDENYRPRAQRNWIEVAGFDYPLDWNPLLREFKGFTPAPVTLPVIDVDSDLKELTPGKVDLDFAQDLDVKLPRIKLLDLASDAINEVNAPLTTFSNAIASAVQGGLDTSGATKGFRSLQTLLREDAEGFFRPVLEAALTDPANNVVDNLYAALAPLAGNKAALLAQTAAVVNAGSNGLQTAILNLNGATGDANKVVGQLARTLQDADDTIGLFQRVLQKDNSGKRHVVEVIIQKLVRDQGPALGVFTGLSDSLVDGLLAELDPTLSNIESELADLRSQFQQVRAQIGAVPLDTDFNESLELANHDPAALQTFMQQAGGAVSNLLNDAVGPSGDFFTADPVRAKQEIRERLVLAFLGSPIPGKYQETFRQFFYDKNFLLDQLMNVLFDQVNRSIRNGLEQQVGIAGAKDGVFQNLKGAGLLSQSLLSAKIRGAPTFQGDSLRAIHLDSQIKMNLPDEMKFTAYMDIKELNSATTPIACIPRGGPSAEVTLGANDVPLDWLGVPSAEPGGRKLTLSVAARWTLQNGAVRGIGGSLDIAGKAGFKGCEMSEIKAALAIGEVENYFAAQAKATVIVLGVPVDFRGGLFAGHACSLDALKFIDPDVEQVVMQPGEFSGVYLEFGGGLSLSDILFGESSDLLDVRADISTALFYQGGPRLGRIGGRQKCTVDVKLLYVLEGSAGWTVFVVLDTAGQLTVGGSAEVCGRIGVCPFCVEGCKDVRVKGVINDGGIDYFIDY